MHSDGSITSTDFAKAASSQDNILICLKLLSGEPDHLK